MKTEKHNHKFTNILKGTLFAIVMLLPFIAIGTTSAYVIFNKNAKDSYSGDYEFKESTTINKVLLWRDYERTELTNLESGKNLSGYKMTINYTNNYNFKNDSYNNNVGVHEGILYQTDNVIINNTNNYCEYLLIWHNLNRIIIKTYTNINTNNIIFGESNLLNTFNEIITPTYTLNTQPSTRIKIEFNTTAEEVYFWGKYNVASEQYYNKITEKFKTNVWYTDITLSAVFYTQTNKIWQAPLFNWVMNGPFYTSMTAFTNLFGIPNQTFFSNLLVYWLTMICIYIIIDIILELFIYLSHFLFEKKADL